MPMGISSDSHSLASNSVHVCSLYETERDLCAYSYTVLLFVWIKTLRFEEVSFLCASNVSM